MEAFFLSVWLLQLSYQPGSLTSGSQLMVSESMEAGATRHPQRSGPRLAWCHFCHILLVKGSHAGPAQIYYGTDYSKAVDNRGCDLLGPSLEINYHTVPDL